MPIMGEARSTARTVVVWAALTALATQAWAAPTVGTAECPARLRWTNATGGPLELDVESVGPRKVAAASTAAVCRPAGATGYLVRAAHWQYAGTLAAAAGDQRTVVLRTPGGTLTVHNRSAEAQAIRIDGAPPADLGPGQTKTFGPLPAGEHRVAAESLRSAQRWGGVVSVAPGRQAIAVVPAPRGKLKLRNPLDEPVRVLVDGQPFGQVEALGELWVVGVGPGGHAVRWQGERTSKIADETWLADDPAARRSGVIALAVRNRTGEDLQFPAELAHLGGVLPADATPTWSLVRGDYRLRATGVDSGLGYWFDVRADSPAAQAWRIERPTATLRVVNQAGQSAALRIHGAYVADIRHGTRATFRVPAGRLQLRATLKGRTEPQTAGAMLQAGEQGQWTIAASDTHIVVVNHWPEPLDVRLDGRRAALVAAGGDVRLPALPGDHHIEVFQHRLSWRESSRMAVRDGDRLRAEFRPPGAAIALDNRRGAGPATLEVDGKGVRAAAGERATLAVPAGTVHAQTEAADGNRERTDVAAAPTQQLAVEPPQRQQVSVTVVGATDRAVAVQLDDGETRKLSPGQRWVMGKVATDRHVITVTDGDRVVRKLVRFDGRRAAVELRIGSR